MFRTRSSLLAAALLPLLVLPGQALAEGGGGGEGPAPAPTAGPCAALTALTLDDTVAAKNADRAQLRYSVESCSAVAQAVTLTFTRTWSWTAADGASLSCDAPGWTGPTVTLRPGAKTSLDVPVNPPGCPYGSNGASSYVYATARSASTGAALATARAHVTYKPGF